MDGLGIDLLHQGPHAPSADGRGRRSAARVERHQYGAAARQGVQKLAEREPGRQSRRHAVAGPDGEPACELVGSLVKLGVGQRAPLRGHGRVIGAGARRG